MIDSQQRLAEALSSVGAGFIATDRNGRVTHVNSLAERVTGWSEADAHGRILWDVLIQEGRRPELVLMNPVEVTLGQEFAAQETDGVVVIARDGTRTSLELKSQLMQAEDGGVQGLTIVFRENDRLGRDGVGAGAGAAPGQGVGMGHRAAQDMFGRFAREAARIGEWDLNLATGIGTHSALAGRCFGYGEAAGEWTFEKFMRHVHPDDRAEVRRSIRADINDMKDWHSDCRVIWPDGSIHWISLGGTCLRENGSARRVLGVVTDITQQRLAEEARLTAQRLEAEKWRIQEASRLRSQFLANMSHELRTPLNSIIGFSDLLLSGAVAPDSQKHRVFLGHIATGGRRLLQLINDVLDLSRVEAGNLEFSPEPLHLPDLVREVVGELRTWHPNKHIDVTVDIDSGLTDLVLDPARLRQVLVTYLSTAVKFAAAGGRVTVRGRQEGVAQVRIEVEVMSIGLQEADLLRLFNEFRQFEAVFDTQHQGSDLGMTLCRRLVEAQGGTVGVSNVSGRGSVVHFILNRIHGTGASGDVPVLPPTVKPNGQRLLVIQDHQHDQPGLTYGLSTAGFDVDSASTGEQAVLRASHNAYDAIALDLLLSDESGLKVLETIRSEGPNRASPVVSVSIAADRGSAATFAIANVLSKPINNEEIAHSMQRFLSQLPRTPRVMVIDDDPAALDLMRATLGGLGIECIALSDGRQALKDIGIHRPDALILDIMMPDFDGFAVLDALRRIPIWRDTPVFIWTNMTLTSEEYASLKRSAHDILSKGGGALETMLDDLRNRRQG